MKKLYYNILIIPAIFLFFSGCFFLIPQKPVQKKSYIIDVKDLNITNFDEAVTVYGETDPKLKISLIAQFQATVTKKGCFKMNNGWSAFARYEIRDVSYEKEEFKLSVPIEWDKSFGSDDCKFELESVSLQVSYPEKKYIGEPLDLLLGANNDSYFRIDGNTYYNLARDYKVRYLTGVSSLKCIADKNSDPQFYCGSGLKNDSIKKSDFLPSTLSYGVNIFLRDRN